ncbi:hypothetical protein SAMN04488077_1222 [Roseovarius tolerans]|uniref:Uncharacterized protein n=1 Tax=Roseovarius tolerans TaxID=74031 RepID=A0A1H8HYN8_9RHOB|nr:hypothetical protein [Roseovarius tolerans]SEN61550.1 hypothetical protein SAMN04488077_1222 [Roseovarius tolerans]
MDLSDTPLDQMGASAHAHYKVAEKAQGKAEEHYKSAGIYLSEAKRRVLRTRGMTFEKFLAEHCPIGKSRAYEVIAIADGTKTEEEVRARSNESSKAAHAKTRDDAKAYRRCSADDQPEKPNENNERASTKQSRPQPEPQADPVKEAEDINAKAHAQRIRVLKSRLDNATEDQLQQIEGILNV